MHLKISKQLIAVFIVLLLATSSVAAQEAAQEEIYLPTVGTLTQPEQVAEEVPQVQVQPEVEALDTEADLQEESTAADGAEPDAVGLVSEESRYQDGDGPWAVPREGLFRERGEVSAAAFNANNWYIQNNLGVGTDTPVHRVELNDNVNWVNRLLIRNNNGGDRVSSDVYLTTGTAKGLMIQKYGAGFNKFNWSGIALADYARIRTDTGVKGLIQTTSNGPMYFGKGDTERLRIHTNGGMTVRNTNSTFGLKIEAANNDALLIETPVNHGVFVNNAGDNGVRLISPGGDGIYIQDATDTGMYVSNAGDDGVSVANADDDGLQVDTPGGDGVYVFNAGAAGINIDNTNSQGVYINDAGSDGLFVNSPGDNGLRLDNAGDDGVHVNNPDDDGVQIDSPGDDGLYVYEATGDGVEVYYSTYSSSRDGVYVFNGDIEIAGTGSFVASGTTLNVPDYVFEDEYPLMTLDEVRAFIETEKHLPNVPSEDEIHANGIDLSEFNMRLLEKVEELTLYTLQQEDMIVAQRVDLEAQQSANEAQEETIASLLTELETVNARLAALEAK